MTALIVLAIGPMSVSVHVDAETCLNHVAQLALFLRSDIEIAIFGDTEKKWKFRGQRP